MKEHSRKAGLTLVRDQITRAERSSYNSAGHSAQPSHQKVRKINHGTSEQNMRKNQKYFGGS